MKVKKYAVFAWYENNCIDCFTTFGWKETIKKCKELRLRGYGVKILYQGIAPENELINLNIL